MAFCLQLSFPCRQSIQPTKQSTKQPSKQQPNQAINPPREGVYPSLYPSPWSWTRAGSGRRLVPFRLLGGSGRDPFLDPLLDAFWVASCSVLRSILGSKTDSKTMRFASPSSKRWNLLNYYQCSTRALLAALRGIIFATKNLSKT